MYYVHVPSTRSTVHCNTKNTKIMYTLNSKNSIFASCKHDCTELPVQSGLVMTPAQAFDLSKKGVPISTQMANPDLFFDGTDHEKGFVPLDRVRGSDINDMWNSMHSTRKTLINSYNSLSKKHKED